ncbi:MAG: hypothetical protein VCB99_00680 [Myxococcota bacterium]
MSVDFGAVARSWGPIPSPQSIRRPTLAVEELDYATQYSHANSYDLLTGCIHELILSSRICFGTDVLVRPYGDPLTGPNPLPISPLLDIMSITGPKKGL